MIHTLNRSDHSYIVSMTPITLISSGISREMPFDFSYTALCCMVSITTQVMRQCYVPDGEYVV